MGHDPQKSGSSAFDVLQREDRSKGQSAGYAPSHYTYSFISYHAIPADVPAACDVRLACPAPHHMRYGHEFEFMECHRWEGLLAIRQFASCRLKSRAQESGQRRIVANGICPSFRKVFPSNQRLLLFARLLTSRSSPFHFSYLTTTHQVSVKSHGTV